MWWNWAKTSKDLEAMTWTEFQDLFMGKYFPDTARHAKAVIRAKAGDDDSDGVCG